MNLIYSWVSRVAKQTMAQLIGRSGGTYAVTSLRIPEDAKNLPFTKVDVKAVNVTNLEHVELFLSIFYREFLQLIRIKSLVVM